MTGWRTFRLKHLAALPIQNGLGEAAQHDDPTWPRYIRTTDIAGPRTLRPETFASLPVEVAHLANVQRGDLLMSAAGTVGRTLLYDSDDPACFAGYLVRFRPGPDVHPGFLAYWTETALFQDQIEVGKVRSTIDNFSAGKYRNILIRLPDVTQQRAIADYLDAETSRIDAVIAKKRRLQGALREWSTSVVHEELASREGVRLKHLLKAPLAYGVLVPVHDPAGIPMLRITDLRSATLDLGAMSRIPASLSQEFRRTVLRLGDLVVSVVGTLGRSIVVGPELVGANLNRALARVQLQPDVPRALIRRWFESDHFQLQARLATSGDSAQPTLGLGDMKNFTVGLPQDRSTWPEIAERIARRLAAVEILLEKLATQEQLLAEHRQALVTAAVSGELNITGVA